MSAVWYEAGREPSLWIESHMRREPTRHEVVVKVEAAGMSLVDQLIITGRYPAPTSGPFIPGTQLAGTITAVGRDAQAWRVGDRVAANVARGAWAGEAVVPVARLVRIPSTVPAVSIAGSIQALSTAWAATDLLGGVGRRDVVIVLGATGSIGDAAAQVARHRGAAVIAATTQATPPDGPGIEWSAPEESDLRGALARLGRARATVVIDPVGGAPAQAAFKMLGPRGRHMVVGFASGDVPMFNAARIQRGGRAVVGVDLFAWWDAQPRVAQRGVQTALDAVADGSIQLRQRAVVDLAGALGVARGDRNFDAVIAFS